MFPAALSFPFLAIRYRRVNHCRGAVVFLASGMLLTGCRKHVAPAPVPPLPVPANAPTPSEQPKSIPRAKRRSTPAEPAKPPAAAPPTSPGPALSEYLSTEQRVEYVRQIEAFLSRVERSLEVLRARSSNAHLARALARVDAFVRQAQDARSANDLAAARTYAERADVLARDLLEQ